MNDPAFEALFRPQAVAVVGASSDPSRIGGKPIRYYRENRFAGALYPINPNRSEVQGYKAFPSVADVPTAIDFALLAVPAAQVIGALEQCARKGAKAAVVFSAGFAEIGGDGPALQQQLVAAAKANGVRLIGPNCLGVFNAAHGHYATFSSFLEKGAPPPGRVAIVSQSGAYGTHLLVLGTRRGLGTNYWVTTGNEADLSVADCIDFLAGDDGTDVICSYVEGVKDGARFVAALDKARRVKKPVILMKVGRSATGALAAASHTASLAGSDEVFDAVLRQYGAERAETTEQLIDFAYAATRMKFPRSRRLGLLTISGGAGVLMADAAERAGLEVAAMPEDSQKKLLAMNPFAGVRNPVDVTAQVINDFTLLRRYIETMLDEGGYEIVCGFFTWWPEAPGLGEKLRQTLAEALQGREDRLLFLAVTGPAEILARYEALGFLVYEDASRAVAAIGALARFGERFAAVADAPPAAPAGALPPPRGTVDEHEAKRILASAGVPVLDERLVNSAEGAVGAAEAMGSAVALKIVSPDILHKTEIGGVLLGLSSGDAVRDGYERIVANARRAKPNATIAGVLVSPMAGDGVEAIVGMRNDPVFGPVMVLGLGGIFVEVLRDTALRVGAVSVAEARRMIDELRGRALFAGVRGRGPADVGALAEAISRLSAWAAAHRDALDSVEINPLLVREDGKGAVALDALIVRRPAGDASA